MFNVVLILRRALPLVLLFTTGCTLWSHGTWSHKTEAVATKPIEPRSVSLFMTSPSGHTVFFEQYQLREQNLFAECGTVLNGQTEIKEQKALGLPVGISSEVLRVAQAVSAVTSKNREDLLQKSISNEAYLPDTFLVALRSADAVQQISTSFISVAKPSDSTVRGLRSLARVLRTTAGGNMCGNRDFYGLNSRKM